MAGIKKTSAPAPGSVPEDAEVQAKDESGADPNAGAEVANDAPPAPNVVINGNADAFPCTLTLKSNVPCEVLEPETRTHVDAYGETPMVVTDAAQLARAVANLEALSQLRGWTNSFELN